MNVAPILANIYLAKLEKLLLEKCKTDKKLVWPILFRRFIDDGFGITKGNRQDFEYWVSQFNSLRETITIDKYSYGDYVEFMDLFIFKGDNFDTSGKFDISVFQKQENKYMYIPATSGHAKHTIKNFIIGELKRYVRYNTIKKNFLKIRNKFYARLRNRGYKKTPLKRLFRCVKFGQRKDLLAVSSEMFNFRETRDSEVECNLIRDSERIFQDTFSEEINFSEENNPRCTIQNISVSVPFKSVKVDKVGCF